MILTDKSCRACGKPLFEIRESAFKQRAWICVPCGTAVKKAWNHRNPERAKEIGRAGYKRNAEKRRAKSRKYCRENKRIKNAQLQAHRAKKAGTLKPLPCRDCGATSVEAHHEDYSKPLEVIWLCPKHHRAVHLAK